MTACLFKVEANDGRVLGMYPDKASAKDVRSRFPIYSTHHLIGYAATVHRGPAHDRGETGRTKHRYAGAYWVQDPHPNFAPIFVRETGMGYHAVTGGSLGDHHGGEPAPTVTARSPTELEERIIAGLADLQRRTNPIDALADSADMAPDERRRLHELAEQARGRTW